MEPTPKLTRVRAVEGRTVFAIRDGRIDPTRLVGRDGAKSILPEGELIDLSISLYRNAVMTGDLEVVSDDEKGSE